MKFTEIFSKPTKTEIKGAESVNHRLLTKAGFIDQLMTGVYTYLPLGLRVLKNIENIVRDEMIKAGGIEILMPALHPAENWKMTGRWESVDDLFRFTSLYSKKEMALGPTHEEILSPLAKRFTKSYRDFPFAVFQIQTKFRDEKRAKSGILRGREFLMKDYYSFHTDEEDLDRYYDKMKKVYNNVFKRLEIDKKTYLTYASGGTFSKFSHEYQTVTEAGEDTIYICQDCKTAINKEILELLEKKCPECNGKKLEKEKAIEVGNIFKLKDKFTRSFEYFYTDKNGKGNPVLMGCYGIGISRLMGAIVEVYNDKKGILWPKEVAPFDIHLINIDRESEGIAKNIYDKLTEKGFEVLWDNREESAGVKLADADLIGIPERAIVSRKTMEKNCVELKKRDKKDSKLVKINEIIKYL